MEKIIDSYYKNNATRLHKIVDKILLKFGGICQKDYDDFYSIANEVFVDILNRYDSSKSFDNFLYSCLSNKIKTEITRRNREKRQADRMSRSLDMNFDDESNSTLADVIADDFDVEKEIFDKSEDGYSTKMILYLSRLSNLQKRVLGLTIAGYKPYEIREKLHMSEKEYSDCNMAIHSYKNVSVLF